MSRLTYVMRNLLQRKIRSGLSMLGVSVAVAGVVALISVSLGLKGSLDHYMEASGASLLVFSGQAADLVFSTVTLDDVATIRGIDGVDAVSRVHFTAFRPERTGDKGPAIPAVFLFGRYPEERIMNKYSGFVKAGRLLEKPTEILVSRFVAETLGCTLGSKVPIYGAEYEVVRIFDSDVAWENGGVVIHADVLGRQLGRADSYTLLFVYTAEAAADRVRTAIETGLPHLRAVPPRDFTNNFADQLEIVDEFIALITVIATAIGILGVLNTMMMSVSERTREIGTLRALGWSRGRVLRTVLVEGLLISCIGGAFGLVLGVLGTEALVALWSNAYLVASYLPSTFVKGGLVAVVVGVSAALYPAYRAASLKPVEALRYE
jgi:putative ABC transport system permease protein